jgi:hypothetical protein
VGAEDDEELLDPPAPAPAPDDAAAPEADPVASARSIRRRLVGAAIVVATAVAALGVLYPGRQVRPGAADYQAATADPIESVLPVLRSFVERTRGLSFTGPVSILVLDDQQFAAAAGPAPAAHAATDVALHLGPVGPAPTDSFYDYGRHRIVLRAGPFDAYGRALLVRELARALDDQRFDVPHLVRAAASDADRARALAALVDGDATRVQFAYVATLPATEQQVVRPRVAAARAVDYASNARAFPYSFGRAFVEQLATTGGNAGVDAAFNDPPPSTAQIIEPRLYTNGVTPIGVRPPEPAGAVVDAGTLGRFTLAMLSTRGARVLDAGASANWLGDAYVTYRSGGGYCTRLSLLVGDAQSQQQIRTDFGGLPGLRSLTLFGEDTVRAEFCS